MMPGVCGTSTMDDSAIYTPSDTGVMSEPTPTTQSSFSVLGADQVPPMTPLPEDGHSDEEDNITTKLQQLPAITSSKPHDLLLTYYLGRSSAVGLYKTAVALCSRLAPHVDTGAIFRAARKRPEVSISPGFYFSSPTEPPSSGWMI